MTDEPETPKTPPASDPAGQRPVESTSLFDSLRDALDDLTERATPAVREVSARAAELTAVAASKAAPLARKAGDATADASGKLAERSRSWASELRASIGQEGSSGASTAVAEAPTEAPSPGPADAATNGSDAKDTPGAPSV